MFFHLFSVHSEPTGSGWNVLAYPRRWEAEELFFLFVIKCSEWTSSGWKALFPRRWEAEERLYHFAGAGGTDPPKATSA